MGMDKKYIVSNRGKTYYWISNNKESDNVTLVFLHGLTANHHLFDKQLDFFSKEYSVIVWDAPAHGISRPYKEFTYSNVAEELKTILDKEKKEKVVLIGQSMGGFVSQSFITKYPNMVIGFVAIDTCPYGTSYYSKSDLWWLRQMKWMTKLYPEKVLRKSMAKVCATTTYAYENMIKMQSDYQKDELCYLLYLGFAGFIPEIHDLKIECPVCLILGEKDTAGKIEQYMKKWHQKENYPLHIIKDAAHNSNEDKPEEVNKIIKNFLVELNNK